MCNAWFAAASSRSRRDSSAHRICITGLAQPEPGFLAVARLNSCTPLLYSPLVFVIPRPYAHAEDALWGDGAAMYRLVVVEGCVYGQGG